MNLPSWPQIEEAFAGIFDRRYFANNGPLVQELDATLSQDIDGLQAICVANEMAAALAAVTACEMTGEVLVPAYASPLLLESLAWCGVRPVLCDVSPDTFVLNPSIVRRKVGSNTGGVIGCHVFGVPGDPLALEALGRELGLPIVFDARDALGSRFSGRSIGSFGKASFFSFAEDTLMNAAEGGCVLTPDIEVAKKLRTIRNFHPGETFAPVSLRLNGKMSEAQAALALLSWNDRFARINRCRENYFIYRDRLSRLRGVELVSGRGAAELSYARVVVRIEPREAHATPDEIRNALAASGVKCGRPLDDSQFSASDFPAAARLRATTLELPQGASLAPEDVTNVCDAFERAVTRPLY